MKFSRGGTVVLLFVVLLVCAVSLLGCEDRADVPADVLNQLQDRDDEQTPPAPPRPTTQALLEAKRVPMMLESLPLLMQVPPQWKITRHGTAGQLVWLEGPTPSGDVHIQLKTQQPIPTRRFEELLLGIRRELDRGTDEPGALVDHRRLGPAHIIERRSIRPPISAPVLEDDMPVLDDKGDVLMHTMIPVRWQLNVYIPGQEGYVEDHLLNFIDLEKPQYEADREFIEGILKTLRYTGTVVGEPDGATPAPPPANKQSADRPAAR